MNIPSQLMIDICNDPRFGYSQGNNRWGNDKLAKFTIDGNDYYINQGDRDCGAAIISVYNSVYPNKYPFGAGYYTGNMIECALETGNWEDLGYINGPDNLLAGDVLVRNGHTEMYVGDGKLAGFRSNEFGGIIGGEEGDQTGNESSVVNYFQDLNNPWHAIRFKGFTEDSKEDKMIWPCLFTFLEDTDVHVTDSLYSDVVAKYDKGESVLLNGHFSFNNDLIWAEYNAAKTGIARYVAVGKLDKVREY